MPEESQPKLSVAGVLHETFRRLGLHPDTEANLHQLVDDNLATEAERAAAARNPWADKPYGDVVDAALAGDKDAAAEYRSRKERGSTDPAPAEPVSEA